MMDVMTTTQVCVTIQNIVEDNATHFIQHYKVVIALGARMQSMTVSNNLDGQGGTCSHIFRGICVQLLYSSPYKKESAMIGDHYLPIKARLDFALVCLFFWIRPSRGQGVCVNWTWTPLRPPLNHWNIWIVKMPSSPHHHFTHLGRHWDTA